MGNVIEEITKYKCRDGNYFMVKKEYIEYNMNNILNYTFLFVGVIILGYFIYKTIKAQ